MKKIVIVGAGFGGMAAALALDKMYRRDKNISITLIDKREYHLFTPNLFEAATTEEEFTGIAQIKKSIALPIKQILKNTSVKFVRGELESVDRGRKSIAVGWQNLEYDYLVLALGSTSEYYGIEGAAQHALPLKSLNDAFRIRNAVEFLVQSHRSDAVKNGFRIVIAGGGYTGVELAGEMHNLLDIVCWKNSYPREKAEVVVVEAAHNLMPGFDDRVSKAALYRLKTLDVRVEFNKRIAAVDRNFVEFMDGEKMHYDLLVWSAGVRAMAANFLEPVEQDIKGRLVVNEYLQLKNNDSIFVVGDGCCAVDKSGKAALATAQDAVYQGSYVARALSSFLKNRKPQAYRHLKHGFIVNVGGKWAILRVDKWYAQGFAAYLADKLAHLRYYRSLLGFKKAFFHVFRESEIFGRND